MNGNNWKGRHPQEYQGADGTLWVPAEIKPSDWRSDKTPTQRLCFIISAPFKPNQHRYRFGFQHIGEKNLPTLTLARRSPDKPTHKDALRLLSEITSYNWSHRMPEVTMRSPGEAFFFSHDAQPVAVGLPGVKLTSGPASNHNQASKDLKNKLYGVTIHHASGSHKVQVGGVKEG